MRVCHLTSVHSYSDTRIFLKECRWLAKAGFEVHLIAPGAPNEIIEGVHVHGIEKNSGNRVNRIIKTTKKLFHKALSIEADIYHFHDPELIPIGLKLKKLGKKVVYDAHEDVPRQILNKHWLPFKSQKVVSRIFEWYECKSSTRFDLIVTATPFIRNRFLEIKIPAININNYPILDELKNEGSSWLEKEKKVCYAGGINGGRGIMEIINAIEISNSVGLLLAGKFTSNHEREVVKNLPGWRKVEELGYLDRNGVKDVYRRSVAGLVTLHPLINYVDSLPIKMFEYMAAEIPVIASNFPLWKQIIEENECGICVNPLDPRAIANAISFLDDNPKKAAEMGRNGRKAVEKMYNWEMESIKLIEAYQNLINK